MMTFSFLSSSGENLFFNCCKRGPNADIMIITLLKNTHNQNHQELPSAEIIHREIYMITNVTAAVVVKSISTSLINVLVLV